MFKSETLQCGLEVLVHGPDCPEGVFTGGLLGRDQSASLRTSHPSAMKFSFLLTSQFPQRGICLVSCPGWWGRGGETHLDAWFWEQSGEGGPGKQGWSHHLTCRPSGDVVYSMAGPLSESLWTRPPSCLPGCWGWGS